MKILIINIGPYGDVLRTTILLNEFKEDEVYWLTSENNKDILKSKYIKRLFFIENFDYDIFNFYFDKVISLNEEYCDITNNLKYKQLIGVFKNVDEIDYTEDSSYWFDMSLISKLGKEKANDLKKDNRLSYNQILIEMVGGKWIEQKYILDVEKLEGTKIGLIVDVEGIWKSKKWNYFDPLNFALRTTDGFEVKNLAMRDNILEHIQDINECDLIVCPDTFGMHIGIALEKKVIALFNSTSPHEIYDYGKLVKIVSPLYETFFYTKEYNVELSESIKMRKVSEEIKKLLS